ncbi:MAG: exonuclease domain-containing protein, partial [Bacteroidota bacterium]
GGNTQSDRITEIAILIHDGEKVVEEYSSLVNPIRRIPYRISSITGITNDMVKRAPKFYEIAKKIVEMTEGHTFVAHNARFDYNFIRKEFKSLGFDYKRKQLCTVELSRQLLPGMRSYALGKLCQELGIETKIRHRALADAEVTVILFEKLMRLKAGNGDPETLKKLEEIENRGTTTSRMSPDANLHKERIDQLPREAGVYYFYNQWHQLIYVGKSVDIRSRVLSHFSNNTTSKAVEMKQNIAHIRCAVTGSELIALLKESEEIKRLRPLYNRAQRRSRVSIGLYMEEDAQGYQRLKLVRLRKGLPEPITAFSKSREAKGFLEYIVQEFELCQTKCGLHRISGPCFRHSIHLCHGACVGKESPEDYNARVEEVLNRLRFSH